ncbi:MAG TPA: hypothetical protein VFB21_05750 [Chthonomonadaceae bacterium]|nr:hypothetical protein [Chthonomonadaceae bacterium]
MAIKVPKNREKSPEIAAPPLGSVQKPGPVVVSVEESEALKRYLAEPTKPLSAETRRAIASHKCAKIERIR